MRYSTWIAAALGAAALGASAQEPAVTNDTAPLIKPAAGTASTSDTEPQVIRIEPVETTVIKLDRGDWPRLTVGPADGHTAHLPTYVLDPLCWGREVNPLAAPQVEWQLNEAMSGATAENGSWHNISQGLAAPVVAAGELAVLPVTAIIAPPWMTVQTPPAAEDRESKQTPVEPQSENEPRP